MSPVAEKVRELRSAKGWTREKLAVEAGVGFATVVRVELGKRLSLDTAEALADAFEVSLDELLGRTRSLVPSAA